MKFTIRYREILIKKCVLTANTHKEALAEFVKKFNQGHSLDAKSIGLSLSIETITSGDEDDYQPKQKPYEHPPPRRFGKKKLADRRKPRSRTDCESETDTSGISKDR